MFHQFFQNVKHTKYFPLSSLIIFSIISLQIFFFINSPKNFSWIISLNSHGAVNKFCSIINSVVKSDNSSFEYFILSNLIFHFKLYSSISALIQFKLFSLKIKFLYWAFISNSWGNLPKIISPFSKGLLHKEHLILEESWLK